jgi:potassium-dependent mechanosensitive channel
MLRRSLPIILLSLAFVSVAVALAARATDFAQLAEPSQQQQNVAPDPSPSATPPVAAQPAPLSPDGQDSEEPLKKVSAPKLEELLSPVVQLSVAIEETEAKLELPPGSREELAALRAEIEKIQFKAKAVAEALQPRLEEVRKQIAKLGEPPAEGKPPEAPEVVAERDRLNALAAQIDGAIKKASLIEVRAEQLVSRVQHVRQGIFTRFLLQQTDSPLLPAIWTKTAEQLATAREKLAFIGGNWWRVASQDKLSLFGILLAALAAFILSRFLAKRLLASRLNAVATSPALSQRAANAVLATVAFALPYAVAAILVYVALDEMRLLYWQVERLAQVFLFSFLVFIAIAALARATLQPTRPQWRIFNLADASAATICLCAQVVAGIYAADFVLRRTAGILSLPDAVGTASAGFASLLVAGLIFIVAGTPFAAKTRAPGAPVSRWQPLWLKLLLVALAIAVVSTALLGYGALSRYIAGQVLITGSGILLLALLHFAVEGLRPAAIEAAEGHAAPAESKHVHLLRALRYSLNAVLLLIATPLVLLTWGVSAAEIFSWMRAAIFGFEVAGAQISLARIFFALVLFATLLGVTRLFQRWLASRALPATRWEPGLANSVYTGAGYIGIAVAALAAVSYAGFDITSLAIVAGALSVGIGFGLQSIVNNFVSGLILLIERPIKVGDWVSTRDGSGYVRRIAVRATEIETFDRASLIVPNSEMISQTVTNLTLRNQLGRLNIAVRISYAADPELAQRVLQQVADANTSILRHPAPLVVLDNLGDQAMEYTVRVYLADINRSLATQTELRTEIVKALRAAGIDIPYFAVQIGHASGPRLEPDRVEVKIAVAYSADPEVVLEALEEAVKRCPHTCEEPVPEVAFDDISDGALEFSMAVTAEPGANTKHVETALRTAAVKMLRARGVDLAGTRHAVLHDQRILQAHTTEERRAPGQRNGETAGTGTPDPKPKRS